MENLKLKHDIKSNTIIFNCGNNIIDPIIALESNGDIFVKGELIENDKKLVDAMREFLEQTGFIKYLKNIALLGVVLMLFGLLFGIAETIYFGSNWLPESNEELLCDFISTFIAGGGCVLFSYAIFQKTIYDIKKINRNG